MQDLAALTDALCGCSFSMPAQADNRNKHSIVSNNADFFAPFFPNVDNNFCKMDVSNPGVRLVCDRLLSFLPED